MVLAFYQWKTLSISTADSAASATTHTNGWWQPWVCNSGITSCLFKRYVGREGSHGTSGGRNQGRVGRGRVNPVAVKHNG